MCGLAASRAPSGACSATRPRMRIAKRTRRRRPLRGPRHRRPTAAPSGEQDRGSAPGTGPWRRPRNSRSAPAARRASAPRPTRPKNSEARGLPASGVTRSPGSPPRAWMCGVRSRRVGVDTNPRPTPPPSTAPSAWRTMEGGSRSAMRHGGRSSPRAGRARCLSPVSSGGLALAGRRLVSPAALGMMQRRSATRCRSACAPSTAGGPWSARRSPGLPRTPAPRWRSSVLYCRALST
mmetsp:Transcript_45253/g.130700  ORF Transcript_45253/g.130700 Transcript_45253/m.130700 type:complete len:236 (-) Transcript_45253:1371-2078(-)